TAIKRSGVVISHIISNSAKMRYLLICYKLFYNVLGYDTLLGRHKSKDRASLFF
ncbi:MAG: hypothetical protein ACJA1P_002502, partial [Maribacter sp.]